ncbi:hypothetical protein GCM10016272_09860 [Psychrobacter glaciei]|uniref:Uncharacterized protein n=1 Tax=Psychrobacter glaciei TaxID=619771 RepID=A0ABQ3GRH5_9GAMM|nr:hypothetical protein GCM10016272_09860 [Psychrobacter glaciei]
MKVVYFFDFTHKVPVCGVNEYRKINALCGIVSDVVSIAIYRPKDFCVTKAIKIFQYAYIIVTIIYLFIYNEL